MAVLETVRKAIAEGDVDFLREGVRVLAQAVMEAEVTELTGVPKGERDPERRLTRRNGYRERRWDTRVGTIDLAIPRVRDGSYFPSPARAAPAGRAGPARGRPGGVRARASRRAGSTTSSRPRASPAISKSEVSRICAALDAEVEAFRSRPLAGEAYPYLWLDATYLKVREAGRVVSMAALVATGVATSRRAPGPRARARGGQRRGLAPGPPSSGRSSSAASTASASSSATTTRPRQGRPRAAPGRGLAAVPGPLHPQRPGPRAALGPEHGRDARSGRSSSSPTRRSAREQLGRVDRRASEPRFPAVADLLADAEADLLAHFAFPETHRRQIRSHQPARAAQQGDQAPDRGRRDLPQPGAASSASSA